MIALPSPRLAFLFCLTTCVALAAVPAAGKDFVWIEAERPTSSNIDVKPSSARHSEWLSDGKWLFVNIDADKVDKQLPPGGAVLSYAFAAPKEASYQVWNRAGMEFVRTPFEWRIDGGAWQRIQSKDPKFQTVDLTELDVWNEIAWLDMGEQKLTAGTHQLDIRLPATKDEKGAVSRVLYASDCLCLSAAPFHPNGKYKPGEAYRDGADEAAAKQVFELPAPPAPNGERSSVKLTGQWEICRDDEALPGGPSANIDVPMGDLPAEPHWKAIAVPGDKNELRPEMLFAHRVWYRTRVNVPAATAGRSFFLTFPQNNLNTTVVVNGVACGFNKFPYVHFDVDVSKGIKPGQVNEICVGIRDAWYGYSTRPGDPMKLREKFNLPLSFTHMGFQDLAWPVWGAFESGILVTPTLTAAGGTYATDLFVKPSVTKKAITVTLTLDNSSDKDSGGEVTLQMVNQRTGKVELTSGTLHPPGVSAHGRKDVEITTSWADAKLWSPDDPQLYTLRVLVHEGGRVVDSSDTVFGFREWGVEGKHFTLNGVPWRGWNMMGVNGSTKEQWLDNYHKNHQTTMRMSGATQGGSLPFFGLSPDEALDWTDAHGVPVRRCGILDGEAIGYMAVEGDPALQKLYKSEIKMQLLNNWVEQMAAQVKGERNHPSVQLWSIENEWLYINCINLYGGLMDQFEAQATRCMEAVRKVDPTRTVMTDGGAANKDQSMPVHGNHYVALDCPGGITAYPEEAYKPQTKGGGRGRWVWDEQRPRYLGEDFYFTGNHPELAAIGGEAALGGKASTLEAAGLMVSILQQGYRWADFGAWALYLGPNDTDESQWRYFQPRVALVKEWDWTFAAGQSVKRTVGVFNDTQDADPITFSWEVKFPGLATVEGQKELHVRPGGREVPELTLDMPSGVARQEGEWVLKLSVKGQEVFRDTKALSVLPPVQAKKTQTALAIYDPAGAVAAFLKGRLIPFTSLADLKSLPDDARVLIIGKDALDATESTSSRLAAWASAGKSLVVLEQKNPLRFQAIPADMEPATNEGRVGFAEDLGHPVFAGLRQKDFFTWGRDQILYRNAYAKPTRGGKSLLQCDSLLQNCALVEVPAGKGVMLLSQLTLEEKLADNAVAAALLENLIEYGGAYKQAFRPVAASAAGAPQLARALDAIGLQYEPAPDPLAALARPGGIAVLDATPANLKALADDLPKVEQFTASGGWIVLNGLTPDGLASYNKLVGFDHMIRKFTRERVTFPALRDPLSAGITTGDIALYSSKRVFDWTEGNYVVDDEFSYVVDYDEVAPFATSTFQSYDKIVNGFVNADGWPLIINFPVNKDGAPFDIPLTFPKPQTLTEFTWIGNTNYWPTTKVNLIFNGNPKEVAAFDVAPTGDAQVLPIDPPRTAKQLTLQLAGWQELPGKGALLGIDNISLKAQRPPDFYQRVKPLVNVGGLMRYPRGQGGIVLCNLLFKESEEVPANAVKKQKILATVLRNLNAPFAGKSVIAGANLTYEPIDLSKKATAFRDEKGWFGDKNFTFRDLPSGMQTLAGVRYDVYQFATSPVPTAVMLAGGGVPGQLPASVSGIAVNRKADALFFLQAARVDRRRSPDEIKKGQKYELARYVIHYADGKTEAVPVYAEINLDDYHQKSPTALPGAQIAWTRPYEKGDQTAVAYSMQWNNPRPEVAIASVDLLPGKDNAGVPALLALTAASSAEGK